MNDPIETVRKLRERIGYGIGELANTLDSAEENADIDYERGTVDWAECVLFGLDGKAGFENL